MVVNIISFVLWLWKVNVVRFINLFIVMWLGLFDFRFVSLEVVFLNIILGLFVNSFVDCVGYYFRWFYL